MKSLHCALNAEMLPVQHIPVMEQCGLSEDSEAFRMGAERSVRCIAIKSHKQIVGWTN